MKLFKLSFCIILFISVGIGKAYPSQECPRKDERIVPKGIQSETWTTYKLIPEAGDYKKTFSDKIIRKYDTNGNVTELLYFETEKHIRERISRTFDKKGNLLEKRSYDEGGSIVKKTVYKYSEDGKITEWSEVGRNGNLKTGRYVSSDNDSGRVVRSYDADGKLEVVFECGSSSFSMASYGAGEKLLHKSINRYKDHGKVHESTVYWDGRGETKFKYDYLYGEKGNVTQENAYIIKEGKKKPTHVYKYDDNGRTREATRYIGGSHILSKVKYVNEYDSDGNVTKVTEYDIKKV